jgi:AhpD family alkylhydroperoxidase
MNKLNDREERLVALGAAIASNCVPCVEYHIPEARKAGLSDGQIREAVKIADKVRRVPARAVLETALAKIEECTIGAAAPDDAGCGCAEVSRSAESGCARKANG